MAGWGRRLALGKEKIGRGGFTRLDIPLSKNRDLMIKVWKNISTIPPVRDAVYWLYEYCGVGHPIIKEEVKFSAYPCLRARKRGNKMKINDQEANLFMLGRYHIDHHIIETITWEPWLETTISEIEDVLTVKLLSRKRIPLQVLNENYEYYLEDRCWRFLDCEQLVIGEERGTYVSYWAEQTSEVGHPLIDSQRIGNIYQFGPTALKAGITPVVVSSAPVHSLSQDFSLPGDPKEQDPGWQIK
ncbi:hypothetical protein GIB67_015558 [Kingdonia uniflora]|uniref:Uncharacterized protein n=1 Tax=Kingdonia uniflora TaxID=39325 RepID=A0A7J7LUC9_9MAGN|nr:hypothetical protein GIB67_015558 [Kingdonia uniflora]